MSNVSLVDLHPTVLMTRVNNIFQLKLFSLRQTVSRASRPDSSGLSSGSPYKSGSSHITSQVWLGFDLNSEAQAFNCLTRLNSRGPVSTSNLPQSIDHWLLN